MSKYRKIDFSTAEFEALNNIVSTLNAGKLHGTLTKLIGKMERAMAPAAEGWGYKHSDAEFDARLVLGDRLVMPAWSVLWASKINKSLAANNTDSSVFVQACKYVAVVWKGPVFFDSVVFQAPKLAAMPVFEKKMPTVNKGYAYVGPNEEDDLPF